jgi:hypothetical protein
VYHAGASTFVNITLSWFNTTNQGHTPNILEAPYRVKWSIDSGDAYSVARVRHAVIDTLSDITSGADLFDVETTLGELLGGEMERGHLALVVTVERSVGGPSVHVFIQGRPGVSGTHGELRRALLQGSRVPMSVESTAQGTHYVIRIDRAVSHH